MIVTCDSERWSYVGLIVQGALGDDTALPCGRTFEDVTHSTICPHEPLPPRMSEEELQEVFNKLNTEKERSE